VRVYYEDTDFSGNVYHAAYLHFFERARTEMLRSLGILHSVLARDGITLAVREMKIDFARAAHIDDLVVVETRVLAMTGARLTLEQIIARGAVELARARVVVVALTRRGRASRMPKAILTRFSAG
jgi:acyl-CoA thioester hydrolase